MLLALSVLLCAAGCGKKESTANKPGTGGVYQINEHLFEGRYTPTNAEGKRESHNVYAHTEEECEEKLAVMIREVKARIQKDREQKKALSA